MSERPHPSHEALPPSVLVRLDKVCDRFEAAWKMAASTGQRPRIEDYLGNTPEPERCVLLRELIDLDIDYRRQAGENPTTEEYRAFFAGQVLAQPDMAITVSAQTAMEADVVPAASESEMSRSAQAAAPFAPGPTRIRCPHCQNPILLSDERPNDVLCPACGSSFRVREARQTTTAGTMRPLGKFQLLERVGLGAFGAVWKARDTELDRIVALKIPHASLLASEADLERFYREARAAAQLRHPGIVTVHEVQTLEGLPTIVSDFIEGVPLKDLLEVRRLTFREAAGLLADLAEAVDYAHGMGLVHRDLKPANIMLESVVCGTDLKSVLRGASSVAREEGEAAAGYGPRTTDYCLKPLIMDFGLALRQEAEITLTLDGLIVGTPAYMSPEQAAGKGHQADRRSDVYSLGVILYELLCGELPFRGSTRMMLHQVQWEEPRPPRRINDKIPRDLETICLKAMAKAPTRRYAAARELAEDVRRFLNGEPIQARPVSTGERLWRWCRRNPARATAVGLTIVAVLSVVALAVGAVFTVQLREKQQQTEAALAEVEKYRCQLALERGLTLCEQGQAAQGMLWLSHSLKTALGHDTDLQRDIRVNLAGWRPQVHALQIALSHEGWVRAMAFSPDGKVILTGGYDSTVRLWQTSTGKALGMTLQHPARVYAVAFAPDGKTIATGCQDGAVWLWHAGTGKPFGEPIHHQSEVWVAAFSPDGKTLLTGSRDKTAQLWEAGTGKPVGSPLKHPGEVWAAAFCPDGKRIATGSADGLLRLWDAGTDQPLGEPIRHQGEVTAVAFSPDRKTVVTGTDAGTVQVWEVSTGKLFGPPMQHQGWVNAVAFSPDGKFIATGSDDGTARLWETATGKSLGGPLRHRDVVNAVAFSPDGQTVLTGSSDGALLWKVSPGKPLGTRLTHEGEVRAAVFSPDGKFVLTGSRDKTARLWYAGTGEPLGQPLRHKGFVDNVAFSPDGKTIATNSNGEEYAVCLWEAATGRYLGGPLLHQARIWALTFSRDGKTLATVGRDGTAQLWEVATSKPLGPRLQHQNEVNDVAFSPDGKTVATASEDATARLWEAATGKLLATLSHQGAVDAVRFSPDGQMVLTGSSGDAAAQLWETTTGKRLRNPLRHQGAVNAVAFSPDGKTVLTGSSDWTARLWEAATGRPLGPPMQHQGPVISVAYSPDGQTIVTGSRDGTARLWTAATGKPFGTPLRHEGHVFSATFSPNGRTVLTVSWDNAARLWEPLIPVEGEVERIVLWTQVITGLELDADGLVRVLDAPAWQKRRQRLQELGGPPSY